MRVGVVEQEARLLGRLVQANDLALKAAEALRPEHFVERRHRAIFAAVADLASKGRVSPVEVAQHSAVAKAGISFATISELMGDAALDVEVDALIDFLRGHAVRRRMLESAAKLKALCEADIDQDEFELQAASLATGILAEMSQSEAPVVRVGEALQSLVATATSPDRVRRTAVGFAKTLGAYFGGFRAGHLIVLMARPSMGKTALALQWATEAVKHGGAKAVYIASLEMTADDLADRVLLQEAGEGLERVALLPEAERRAAMTRLDDTLVSVGQWPLYISEKRAMRAQDVAVIARRLAAEHGRLDLVIVDYLQLLRLSLRKGQNEAAAIGDACRELRNMAGDLRCPVVVLSQLNRGVELRNNKRPVLSDLRDSGEIEEAADVVISVYREDYYVPDLPADDPRRGKAEVTVLKYRHGNVPAQFIYRFRRERQLFEELTPEEEQEYRAALRRGAGLAQGVTGRDGAAAAEAAGGVRGRAQARQPKRIGVDRAAGVADED